MIDPLGPDPADPALTPRKAPDFEDRETAIPLGPRVRHANYDSPQAIVRPGSPAPSGPGGKASPSGTPTTALARPVPPRPGKLERAIGVAKTVLPIVGNLLPLLEGNVVSAAANLLSGRHEVDLKPLEEAINRLQADQRGLSFHAGEQKRAIRQLQDEFAALEEGLEKHAADQAELAEQVVKLAKRLSSFMRLMTILLIVSILFTAVLVVRIAYILRF